MNKYEIIIETMKKAGFPLSDMQEVLLAGSFSVLIEAAVAKEREACAKVCDGAVTKLPTLEAADWVAQQCAAAIRARGEK